MNINLHIERLILDGLPIGADRGPYVQKAIERELTMLLAAGGVGGTTQTSGHVHHVQAPNIRLTSPSPVQLGGQIAGAVNEALSK